MLNITNNNLELVAEILDYLEMDELSKKVYIQLLQDDSVSITQLALKNSSNRTQIYMALDNLASQNLIYKKPGFNKKIKINPISNLEQILRLKQKLYKEKQLQTNLYLKQLEITLTDKTSQILDYLGVEKMRELFLEIYNKPLGEIVFIGNTSDFISFMNKSYIDYNTEKRINRKIPHRILTNTKIKVSTYLSQNYEREIKIIPLPFNNCLHILQDRLVFWNLDKQKASVIKDEFLVSFIKSMFECVWQIS